MLIPEETESNTNLKWRTVSALLSAFLTGFVLLVLSAAAEAQGGLAIDVQTSHDNSTASTTNSTSAFSTTSANELLLAFVASDYAHTGPNVMVNGISGGGLAWQLVERTNLQFGTAEIWRAFAVSQLSNATVVATLSQTVLSSITVISFIGADSSGSNGSGAIGAVGSSAPSTGAPSVALVTTRNNSWVFGVGFDYDNAISRAPGSNQSLVHQFLSSSNDTFWVQQQATSTAQAGTTVVISDTTPTSDRSDMTAVEVLPAPASGNSGLSIDVQVSNDVENASSTNSTPTFSTANSNELLLAFISADNLSAPNTSVTGVAGGALTWQLVQRTNTQPGDAEIWRAFASTALSNVTVTATLSEAVVTSMTVITFVGADPSGTNGSGAIGATATGNSASGAPSASLTTTRNGSWVFAAGDDFDNSIPRIVGSSQTLRHEYFPPVNDTYWVQSQVGPTPQSGTVVTINDTAPSTDRFNLSLVEVLPAQTASGAPSITSVSPTAATAGTAVTITGSNFGATQGSSTVTFGGVAATVNSWSATSIVAYVPTSVSAGSAPIIVSVTGNGASNAEPFTVTAPPVISSFSPTSAPIGASVSISGSNFLLSGTSPQVSLVQQGGGTIIAPISSATNASISFTIPAGAATGYITVTSGGLSATSSSPLTVLASSTFAVTAAPSSINLLAGQATTLAVALSSTNGFTQGAVLSASGLPTGITASFQPQQVTAGQSAVLTLTAASGQPAGTSHITLTANASVEGIPLSSSATVTVNVQAAGNVAFAGRVAVTGDPYDTPIVGLTVRFTGVNYTGATTGCNASVQTDASGNFLFSSLPEQCSGAQIVQYDPSTVSAPPGKYSGVNLSYVLSPGEVTTPGIVVHLPRVDKAETVQVAQNSSTDQVFTFASIPKLTLVVYAGTTFSLADGSKPDPFPLSVVEIPYDQLPEQMFPDPTQVPVYAMSIEPFNSSSSQPVAVVYPNRSNALPGTTMPLTSLNPQLGIMVNYGTGTVSDDGTQIVPDRDPSSPGHAFGISHFDWYFPLPPPAPLSPSPDRNAPRPGDPVDAASGLLVINKTDIEFGGARGQIAITRTYRTLLPTIGPFGVGTSHNYNYYLQLTGLRDGSIDVRLCAPDGNQFPFAPQQDGTYTNSTIPFLAGAVLSKVFDGAYNLRWKNGTVYQFQLPLPSSSKSFLTGITDTNGNTTTIVRNSLAEIQQIIDPVGRALNFSYGLDSQGFNVITAISDPIGRTIQYGYDLSSGTALLTSVTDPDGGITAYAYDAQNSQLLDSITDARQIKYLQNTYDENGRVKTQLAADGGLTTFSYILFNSAAPTSPVAQTIVTDPLGNVTTYHFNPQGFLLDTTDALGRKTVYARASGTNLLTSTTDPLGHVTEYSYDPAGNTTTIARLAETANPVTTTFSYDPKFNKITAIIDPLTHKTTFSYDADTGNLTDIQDPLQNPPVHFSYDPQGELQSSSTPLPNTTTTFGYLNGDLVSTTDPLQRTTTRVTDGVGRLVSLTNPLGQTTRYQYNGKNQVTAIIDPAGNETDFGFDKNGNLATVKDANQHSTSFGYDSMDRLSSRQDPLLTPPESYLYDYNGNLTQFTDRRNKVSLYTYDQLNRRTGATYGGGESSVSYTYDQDSRLIQAKDSIAGTITRTYDGLDRMLSENTPQGSVSYSYDSVGRRTGMQASGQPSTSYTYDADDRLTQISQGSSSVLIGYDIGNRRTSVTLPNGIVMSYGYDTASQLLGINYQFGNNPLGNLTYSYDLAGHRTGIGGTFARTSLPQAVSSGPYNAANQMTQFGASTLSYDLDGNLISDGVNSYTWDARNHLVSIKGATSATFQYDAFGRRIAKSAGGATTNYLYDSVNPIQELSGGVPVANLVAGLRTDEYFERNDTSGTGSLLTDALGSTIAVANSGASIFVNYTYEPFGNSTSTGSSGNSYQFTGRENDGTGLYFYRGRYYNPRLQRFISEDPLGFIDGPNTYAYAADDPLEFVDPSGTEKTDKKRDFKDCVKDAANKYSIKNLLHLPDNAIVDAFAGNTVSDAIEIGEELGGGQTALGVADSARAAAIESTGGVIEAAAEAAPNVPVGIAVVTGATRVTTRTVAISSSALVLAQQSSTILSGSAAVTTTRALASAASKALVYKDLYDFGVAGLAALYCAAQ